MLQQEGLVETNCNAGYQVRKSMETEVLILSGTVKTKSVIKMAV